MIPMKLEFHGYTISRTMLACAGMGATVAMLVGGTTFGVPTAIVAAIIGAIGGGVLGRVDVHLAFGIPTGSQIRFKV
jgi:uncharacterized membrane protein YjjP (DUF1212 family)